MPLELFSNNATTTLGSAVSSSATTMTVASGTGNLFPSPTGGQFFSATLWAQGSTTGVPNEIVYVTARTGDTMTVVRGQEGTTPQAWNVSDTFANYPTAFFYNGAASIGDVQSQTGNSAIDTGTSNAGVITLAPVPASLAALKFAPIRIQKVASANTGAYTLNVNGLGAQPVTINGAAVVGAQLAGSQVFVVVWDGSTFELISLPARITNAELAQMAATTIKANLTGGTANPADATLQQLLIAIGLGSGSLGNKGYFQVPIIVSGTIVKMLLQWGLEPTLTNQASNTVTFPIAFPNQALLMVGSLGASLVLSSNAIGAGFAALNQTQGRVTISTTSPGTSGVSYFAIGY